MTKHLRSLLACLYCKSDHVQKNGQLPKGGQRFRCTDCRKQFAVGGVRGTYDEAFREKVVEAYCHQDVDARTAAEKFSLSTSTIIARAKKHRAGCSDCHIG